MNYSSRSKIFVSLQSLDQLQHHFTEQTYSKVFVLVDENTFTHCYPFIKPYIPAHYLIEIPSGEQHKTLDTCQLIWDQFTNNNADRNSVLINLGGGIICDMGGFTAACYKRGIEFIHVPTTLLAMVDASVGGKTGIDFKNFKNQIGVFQEPCAVFVFTSFLKTLPHRELLSGFAEVIKHYLIADKQAFTALNLVLQKNNFFDLDFINIVERNIEIKSAIVLQDPFENNSRKALNFGHTIGHAVESHFLINKSSKLLHGEAIAIGIICENFISYMLNFINVDELNLITTLIQNRYNLPVISEHDFKLILNLIQQDKKSVSGKNQFTLLSGIGNYSIQNYVQDKLIIQSIKYYNMSHV